MTTIIVIVPSKITWEYLTETQKSWHLPFFYLIDFSDFDGIGTHF